MRQGNSHRHLVLHYCRMLQGCRKKKKKKKETFMLFFELLQSPCLAVTGPP